jgi:hypothetical protein
MKRNAKLVLLLHADVTLIYFVGRIAQGRKGSVGRITEAG